MNVPEQVMGFLNIDKPRGMTSHDVVARVRRLAKSTVGKVKVGHAGTLDPMATGVLVICVGQATRLSEYAMRSIKAYRAVVHLGVETDTYDAEGAVVATQEASHIERADVENALPAFVGDIAQMPPMYSAIKQGGKKLYDLAREGKTVEREARPVTIHTIDVLAWQPPSVTLDVTCGSGTYIRSIAHDLGAALGVGAHLAALERTRSGSFAVADSLALDALMADTAWQTHLIRPQDALADWAAVQLTDAQVDDVAHGRTIEKTTPSDDKHSFAYTPDGHLLAILENRGKYWKPHKVFPSQS